MVSHVDDDHIQGMLELTKELHERRRRSGRYRSRSRLLAQQLRRASSTTPEGADRRRHEPVRRGLDGGRAAGGRHRRGQGRRPDEEFVASLKVLASIAQGLSCAATPRLEFPLNPEFDGDLILARKEASRSISRRGSLSPSSARWSRARDAAEEAREWLKELKKKGKSPQTRSPPTSTSVPNLSSIVVLARPAARACCSPAMRAATRSSRAWSCGL